MNVTEIFDSLKASYEAHFGAINWPALLALLKANGAAELAFLEQLFADIKGNNMKAVVKALRDPVNGAFVDDLIAALEGPAQE